MNQKSIKTGLTSSGKFDLRKISGKEKALYKKAYKADRTAQYDRMNSRVPTEAEKLIIERKNAIKALHEMTA